MIAIGCDHGGYALKLHIIDYLEKKGFEYKDFGCHGTASVDYPDYALPVAEAVASGEAEKGIIICGTGIGVSIVANKVPGVRADRLPASITTAMFLPSASALLVRGLR